MPPFLSLALTTLSLKILLKQSLLTEVYMLHVKERTSEEKSHSLTPFLPAASPHQPVYQAQAPRLALLHKETLRVYSGS